MFHCIFSCLINYQNMSIRTSKNVTICPDGVGDKIKVSGVKEGLNIPSEKVTEEKNNDSGQSPLPKAVGDDPKKLELKENETELDSHNKQNIDTKPTGHTHYENVRSTIRSQTDKLPISLTQQTQTTNNITRKSKEAYLIQQTEPIKIPYVSSDTGPKPPTINASLVRPIKPSKVIKVIKPEGSNFPQELVDVQSLTEVNKQSKTFDVTNSVNQNKLTTETNSRSSKCLFEKQPQSKVGLSSSEPCRRQTHVFKVTDTPQSVSITDFDNFLKKSKKDFDLLYNDKTVWNLKITDFNIIKKVGAGAFGQVLLGEFKEDKTLYAVKAINKKEVVEKNYIRYVSNEKRVLQAMNFPFVLNLKYFFTDFYFLYFVMPYIPGGNFSKYLKHFQPVSEAKAKFYIGQLVLALEYLHYLELIHRDIKPENIMIDAFGYLILGDFGQCIRCYGNDKTWTFTGTPEYMAPEIIEGKGYDCAVDWWALGIVTFEICAGHRPFKNDDPYKLHILILSSNFTIPSNFSRPLKKFIQNLLVHEPKKRIANKTKRASGIKSHVWFNEINWLALLNRTAKAPYIPDLSKG